MNPPTSEQVAEMIRWQNKVRQYLEQQGLSFMADEISPCINALHCYQTRLEDDHRKYIDRIHP